MGLYFSESDASFLKESVTAREAAEEIGLEINNKNELLCPARDHKDVHYGSCKVRAAGKIYCFVCHRYFSSVDILMEAGGMSYYDSLCTLAEMSGNVARFEVSKGTQRVEKKTVLRRLRNDEKKLLGFETVDKSRAYIKFQCVKPDDDIRYKRTEDGYLVYQKNELSWNWMITEESFQYRIMILNKCYEKMEALQREIQSLKQTLENHIYDGAYLLYSYMIESLEEDYCRVYQIGLEFGLEEVEKAKKRAVNPFKERMA